MLECAHTRQPEGSGRTIHSPGCAIRRSVTPTLRTGEPQIGMPATLTRNDTDDVSTDALTVTAEKVCGMVMLSVDRMR